MTKEIEIPEGYEARIEGSKVVMELKESEDERIRKFIAETIFYHYGDSQEYIDALAYLEKQKEQKQIKFTDLTWEDIVELEGIINNVHYDFSAGIGQESFGKEVLERFRSKKGIEYLDEEQKYWPESQKEQKPAEKQDYLGLNDLERAIHRGFLCAGVENVPIGIIKDTAQDCLAHIKPAEWSEDIIRKAIKEVGLTQHQINWFENNVFPPKQEWSEEDKKMLNNTLDSLKRYQLSMPNFQVELQMRWLKSLRPQSHWKPSEEQMKALNAINCHGALSYVGQQEHLISLYNDIKKL